MAQRSIRHLGSALLLQVIGKSVYFLWSQSDVRDNTNTQESVL